MQEERRARRLEVSPAAPGAPALWAGDGALGEGRAGLPRGGAEPLKEPGPCSTEDSQGWSRKVWARG